MQIRVGAGATLDVDDNGDWWQPTEAEDLAFKINDRLPTMHKGESQKVWSRLCYLAAEAYAPWGGPWLPGSGSGSYDEGVGIV
ncbi:hypothetical protein ACLKA7_012366 [Drosophila subpalustris]